MILSGRGQQENLDGFLPCIPTHPSRQGGYRKSLKAWPSRKLGRKTSPPFTVASSRRKTSQFWRDLFQPNLFFPNHSLIFTHASWIMKHLHKPFLLETGKLYQGSPQPKKKHTTTPTLSCPRMLVTHKPLQKRLNWSPFSPQKSTERRNEMMQGNDGKMENIHKTGWTFWGCSMGSFQPVNVRFEAYLLSIVHIKC